MLITTLISVRIENLTNYKVVSPFNRFLIVFLFCLFFSPHLAHRQDLARGHTNAQEPKGKPHKINMVHTTTKNTLKLNTTHTQISIRLQHHVHSCPFPVQLKITTEINRYIQRNTHNRGNKK